jgi:hypothetical protein
MRDSVIKWFDTTTSTSAFGPTRPAIELEKSPELISTAKSIITPSISAASTIDSHSSTASPSGMVVVVFTYANGKLSLGIEILILVAFKD